MSSKQAAKAVVDQGANINAKLNLVVKSGKFRIGKYPTFLSKINIFMVRLQKRHQGLEKRTIKVDSHFIQLPSNQKNRAWILRCPCQIWRARLWWQQRWTRHCSWKTFRSLSYGHHRPRRFRHSWISMSVFFSKLEMDFQKD